MLYDIYLFHFLRNNQPSLKLNTSSYEQQIESEGEMEDEDSINIYSKEQNSILYENDEQISDDEQVKYLSLVACLTYNS